MKTYIALAAALSVSACAALPNAGPSHTELCRTTLNNYFIAIDQHNWDILPVTFTADATVQLRENTMNGLDELRAYFEAREPQPDIVHHLTTSTFEATGANTGEGIVYLLLQGYMPLPDGGQVRVIYSGQYEDEYLIEGGTCKISKRTLSDKYLHTFPE